MIYCIGNRKRGICKIGFTTRDVADRLKELQPANGYDLTIFGAFDGRRAEENALHKKLSAHRVQGEWFTLCPEIAEQFGFRLDEPDHLWATFVKIYRRDDETKYYVSCAAIILAPTEHEALNCAISSTRRNHQGSVVEQMAVRIEDAQVERAYAILHPLAETR